ncbi:MAG: TonB-dependent receptor [Bdellovibrionaceae bacterium]|nr:TonB-dependent receptor [Pseudobdellovibrionaceae bacterium]
MKFLRPGALSPNTTYSEKSILFRVSVAVLVSMTLVVPANAQSTTTTPAGTTNAVPAAPREVERVEVIGTRIRRLNVEGPSAVKTLKKEQMETAGNTTVSDALRDTTSSSFGVTRETSGGNAAATSNIGLRGLGSTRTLILLNGQRLPKDPTTEAVDLNLIPQSAIERVEILKDGASALYGSDALGGVINIVTKKNFTGNEFTIQETMPERKGASNLNVSLLTGMASDRSELLVAFNFNRKEKLFGKDRELTAGVLSPVGTVPVYADSTETYRISPTDTCSPEFLKDNPYGPGQACYFRPFDIATIRPTVNQTSILTEYTYRMDSGLKFYNRNIFVNKDIEWSYAPTPLVISTPSGTASVPDAREILYRDLSAGNRDNQDSERNFSSLVGVKGNVTDIWEFNLSAGISQIQRLNFGVNGYIDNSALNRMIASGAYDPLKAPGARGDITPAKVETMQKSVSDLFTADLVFSGEVGELENGPIATAVGVSAWSEKLNQKTDTKSAAKLISGSSGSNDSGSRDVQSVYSEFSIPATAALELNIAARVDKYSDFGTTANPKLAAKYKVGDSTLLRASVGTGFKAPTLTQLYKATSDGYVTFIDRYACQLAGGTGPTCDANQYKVVSGGNKDLKEEKAITGGFGVVYESSADFSVSTDLWYTKITNVVGMDLEALTEAEAKGINPAQYGVSTNRNASGRLQSTNPIVAPSLNLQEEEISGVDLNISSKVSNSFLGHSWTVDDDLGYIVFYNREGFPGAGKRNVVGEWGYPGWRNNLSTTARREKMAYTLTLRTIPGQGIIDRQKDEKISDLNEFDLTVVYKHSPTAAFNLGVRNILDSKPPYDKEGGSGGSPEVNADLYDVNQRTFFVGYSQKF